jgi:hypothetical protein
MFHLFSILGPVLIVVGMIGSVMELGNGRHADRRF